MVSESVAIQYTQKREGVENDVCGHAVETGIVHCNRSVSQFVTESAIGRVVPFLPFRSRSNKRIRSSPQFAKREKHCPEYNISFPSIDLRKKILNVFLLQKFFSGA
ncbi:hypothetical protein AVEN_68497-1 [Araneus ventricosus]|uniref:Uncharacterized protein n=1 Tax=Araneus ventricosus TaxID=182803 RepID=A0A4Y2I6N3_ARAVE|nr:hypothetical protein AVEN_68497-1 [Araneus ventricosus]